MCMHYPSRDSSDCHNCQELAEPEPVSDKPEFNPDFEPEPIKVVVQEYMHGYTAIEVRNIVWQEHGDISHDEASDLIIWAADQLQTVKG